MDNNQLLAQIRDQLREMNINNETREVKAALEKSLTTFPAAALKGNEGLRAAVMEQRNDLREQLAVLNDTAKDLYTDDSLEEALVDVVEPIQQSMDGLGESFKDSLTGTFGADFKEKFFEGINSLSNSAKSMVSNGAAKIGGGVKDAITGFFDIVKLLGAAVIGTVGITSFIEGWMLADAIFDKNANFGERLAAGFAAILASFGIIEDGEVAGTAKAISETLTDIFDSTMGLFKGIANIVKALFKEDGIDWSTIGSEIQNNWKAGLIGLFALMPGIMIKAVTASISTIVPLLWSAGLQPMFVKFGAWFGTVLWPAISAALSTALATITAPVLAIGAAIVGVLVSAYDAVMSALNVFEDTGSISQSIIAGVSTFFGNIAGFFPEMAKRAISFIAGALGFEDVEKELDSFNIMDIAQDFIANFTDKIQLGFRGLIDIITFAFDNIGTIGAKILTGDFDGISNMFANRSKSDEMRQLEEDIAARKASIEQSRVPKVQSDVNSLQQEQDIKSSDYAQHYNNITNTAAVSNVNNVSNASIMAPLTANPGASDMSSIYGFSN